MIELHRVTKIYDASTGPRSVLKEVTLRVQPGEIFGVIGKSGAGKSTLLRCVNLLERPTSGEVRLDGYDLTQASPAELREMRRRIGIVFQHFSLLTSRTVFQNIALPLELLGTSPARINETVSRLLVLVDLADKPSAFPAQLSGGEKQRVGIARALANKPTILLCDEATSALDPPATLAVLALLKKIQQEMGLTIMLVSHEMEVIKTICTRVALMDQGSLLEQGETLSLLTRPTDPRTKQLLGSFFAKELPEALVCQLSPVETEGTYPVLRITYCGQITQEPLLSQLIRELQVDFAILLADVDYVGDVPLGTLVVSVRGEGRTRIRECVQLLHAKGLGVEVLGYVA